MRITELYLDGFGIYNKESVSELPAGLAVFIGKNESGKTTLMEFIRTMIFGFPSGRAGKALNAYPPLGNGIHGGKLGLQVNDGSSYLINRAKKNVAITDASGQVCNFEPAGQWLGGLDRATFQKVFAIGLSDLQGLDLLSQDNVRSRFFAAGAGSGGASLVSSIGKIDSQLAELLLLRGREQRINKLITQLNEVTSNLRETRKEEKEYAELETKRSELVQAIAQEDKQNRALNARIIELEQMEQAWEPWTQLQLQTERAQSLAFAQEFPADGIVRLEQLLRRIDEYTVASKAKSVEKVKLVSESSQIVVDNALLTVAADIERLYAEKGRFESDMQRYPGQKAEQGAIAGKYQQALAEIGPNWDDPMLDGVDISVPTRQKVQAYAGQLRDLNLQCRQLEISEKQNTATFVGFQQELKNHQATCPSSGTAVKGEEEMMSLEEGLRLLRNTLSQQQQFAMRQTAVDKETVEVEAQLASLAMQETGYQSVLPGWLWLATLVLTMVAGGFLVWQGALLVSAVTAVAGLGLATVLAKQQKRQAEARTVWHKRTLAERERLQLRQSALSEELLDIKQRSQECARLLSVTASSMNVTPPGTFEDVDQLEREVSRIRKEYQSWVLYQQREQELQEKCNRLQAALAALVQEKSAASASHQAACRDWENWLAERHFSVDCSPEGFEIVLKAIETARNVREQSLAASNRLLSLSAYIEGVKQEIKTLLTRCGRKILDSINAKELETLYQELTIARTQERKILHLNELVATAQTEIDTLQEQEQKVQSEKAELLRQGHATEEEQFRKRAQSHEAWKRCVGEIENLQATLRTVAGTAAKQADLTERLKQTNIVAITAEKEQLQQEKTRLEQGVTEKPKQVGSIELRLQQMSQDETLNRLLMVQNEKLSQVRRSAREWAKLVLCRHLLEDARSIYERERQPSVIQEADKFLRLMTDNRYKMIAAIGGSDVQLEDGAKNIKGEITWSNGLADQVYLAIRFGLAQEFGRLLEPVPLILDDILVKFDSTREKGAARALLSVAKAQQILLFSCHERTLDIVREVHGAAEYLDTPVAYYEVANGKIQRLSV